MVDERIGELDRLEEEARKCAKALAEAGLVESALAWKMRADGYAREIEFLKMEVSDE